MRFELNNGEMSEYFTDHETGNTYWFGEHEDFCTVCELLNDLTSTDKVKFEPIVRNLNKRKTVLKFSVRVFSGLLMML